MQDVHSILGLHPARIFLQGPFVAVYRWYRYCSQVVSREVFCHEYGKIPRHTGKMHFFINPLYFSDSFTIILSVTRSADVILKRSFLLLISYYRIKKVQKLFVPAR